MQIIKNIHALRIPFQVTDPSGKTIPRFVYVYLILGEKIYLIDSGVASSENIILDYLKKIGRSPKEISTLILTHSHPDHIGSAKAIKSISGCVVAAHAEERAWIEDVDLQARERPVPCFQTLVGGSVKVDLVLQDGDILDLGDGNRLHVFHTPGHSPGSISLWLPEAGALFCADAVPIPGDMPIYQDVLDSFQSIEKLKSFREAKFLLAAWDNPRMGSEVYRIMDEGQNYLQNIHSAVLKVAAKDARLDSMELCLRVLRELGLPEMMANPLVAASFQGSLRVRNQQDLLKDQSQAKDRMDLSYEDEDKIIWLKDQEALANMGYVLERVRLCPIRTGPVKPPEGEILIGYAVLKKTTENTDGKGFYRRIFTLQPIDRYYRPDGAFQKTVPPESVEPLSVRAGKPSRRLQRQE